MKIDWHNIAGYAFGVVSPLVVTLGVFIIVGWFTLHAHLQLNQTNSWVGFFVLLGIFVIIAAICSAK